MLRTVAKTVTAAALLALVLPVAIPGASADEMTSVYARIVADPTSSELNLQYAMIAEGRKEYRKALAAYERVLVNDPTNESAKRGLARIRRVIQPPSTQTAIELGATWESNPERTSPPTTGDVFGYGSLQVKDERVTGGQRWRTNLGLYGEGHGQFSDLDYANINGDIGPLIDLGASLMTFRPAVGAGAAYFDGKVYYGDVNVSGLLEGYLNGAYQWARVRAGYRDYDPSFSSGGTYADLTGKFSLANLFGEGDVLSIAPWARWSDINGAADSTAIDFATGLYIEGGAKLEYARAFTDAVTAAVNVTASDRYYNDIGSGHRQDWFLSPGASLIFTNVFSPQTDLRFDYAYQWNWSNQTGHTWQNQTVTAAFVIHR